MIVWTPAALSVLQACALYFCLCICSAQLTRFTWKGALQIRSLLLLLLSSFAIVYEDLNYYQMIFTRSSLLLFNPCAYHMDLCSESCWSIRTAGESARLA